ncbi:hypothetical protein AKJ16_DCAP16685 [Drosera capensis]
MVHYILVRFLTRNPTAPRENMRKELLQSLKLQQGVPSSSSPITRISHRNRTKADVPKADRIKAAREA